MVGHTTWSWKWTFYKQQAETSLAIRWLRLWITKAGNMGSVPGWRTKIPHATGHCQKIKKEEWNNNKNKSANAASIVQYFRKQITSSPDLQDLSAQGNHPESFRQILIPGDSWFTWFGVTPGVLHCKRSLKEYNVQILNINNLGWIPMIWKIPLSI